MTLRVLAHKPPLPSVIYSRTGPGLFKGRHPTFIVRHVATIPCMRRAMIRPNSPAFFKNGAVRPLLTPFRPNYTLASELEPEEEPMHQLPTQTESRLPPNYVDIQEHAIIGNMRTAAVISVDGTIEQMCIPHFDSPSVFARTLDVNKGGYFSIRPTVKANAKQGYAPNTNVLVTKFLNDRGVAMVTDFIPLQGQENPNKPLLHWLVRRVECTRGTVPLRMEVVPAFNYARDTHDLKIVPHDSLNISNPNLPKQDKVVFESQSLTLDLRHVVESSTDGVYPPKIDYGILDLTEKGMQGLGVYSEFTLTEGQAVTFVMRTPPKDASGYMTPVIRPTQAQALQIGLPYDILVQGASTMRPKDDPLLTIKLVNDLLQQTTSFWRDWLAKSTYKGAWKEAVHRSALALKLLIFEPTGAIVASPTFSLPESLGGTRNWDYRFSWIRDSSFTLLALIRLGYTQEAAAYMDFIFDRLKYKNEDGSLQIMYTIHGEKDLDEIELNHLEGHKKSSPVRIGNGAANHVQLDIYGELLDCIYLAQKFGGPLGYDRWIHVRELVDYVVKNCHRRDLSIWEVRSRERHFTYSKVMMWVAIDRGIKIAEKRSLPCPNRQAWYTARDNLYEEIMQNAWNGEKGFFAQSYEEKDVLDSAVLVMPLVSFCDAAEPRFKSTLQAILRSPERGGLMVNNLIYRYDATQTDDGVGGDEGAFSLCTLWAIEALTRAGQVERAVGMFEEFLAYGNHVGLFSEEISAGGEGLGNAVQGFTHVTLMSAAYNLSKALDNSASRVSLTNTR